jgi:phosphoribosylglycinamide formyltransferase-1
MKNIAVLISGRGTNLQAIIDAQHHNKIQGKVVLVISNKSDAYGLKRAQKAKIKTLVINHKDYKSREDHEAAINIILKKKNIDLIILAGYMRILTKHFINSYKNQIINIHPSLLPSFSGMNSQKQAFDYGVKITGCTSHFVDYEVDSGPIILQDFVYIQESDTLNSLREKILKKEHEILVKSINLFCNNQLQIVGRKVKIM